MDSYVIVPAEEFDFEKLEVRETQEFRSRNMRYLYDGRDFRIQGSKIKLVRTAVKKQDTITISIEEFKFEKLEICEEKVDFGEPYRFVRYDGKTFLIEGDSTVLLRSMRKYLREHREVLMTILGIISRKIKPEDDSSSLH